MDVAELKVAIPGAQDIEIDQHAYQISRFYLQRDITKHTNVLELTARLIVTLHRDRCDRDLVDGVPEGQFCDHFLVFCPGKPQIRALANLLIRWQELGFTRGLEVVPMYSEESPETWQYFDQPVSGSAVFLDGRCLTTCPSMGFLVFNHTIGTARGPHHQPQRYTSGRISRNR